ncbi:MAG TPA: hypothetical protein VK471_00055 [Solirubrobacterales bacterium]|nr:hypothetical protein [Solirubrobacterales bacterium]
MPKGIPPICAECGQIIWPSEETGLRAFLWYEGDKDDEPMKDELCKGGITHARCADAFGERVAPYVL